MVIGFRRSGVQGERGLPSHFERNRVDPGRVADPSG
jgi:hypothetical protein